PETVELIRVSMRDQQPASPLASG
ncbi:MAG: hypothetical protein QOJ31_883, partial [Gaiellales bacterium]|nr:hypothetical protein [Gaiellales bacterium]